MPIFDISVPLRPGMPVWPGSTGCFIHRLTDQARGDEVTGSTVGMDLHCGTHLDAPLHFMPDGAAVEETDLDSCIGPAFVADLRGVREIDAGHLDERVPRSVSRLLLKTDNSSMWESKAFFEDFSALTVKGAQWVVDRGIRLVANDYLSIQLFGGDRRTHLSLLEAGVVILEGIDLSGVQPGTYELICLPLRVVDAEAAPARAVLRSVGSS
ncbi:MAG: cyclase family protein [Actinomycetota bacterium]|nr:cyclase family protein [Actinomycetota bacterium]